MAVSGTINLSLSAIDTASSAGVEAEKKVSLASTDNISSAVVVAVSGTCGTTAVQVDPFNSGYRGADGELVDFGSLSPSTRIAFVAEPSAALNWDEGGIQLRMASRGNVAISDLPLGTLPLSPAALDIKTVASFGQPSPTASFTVVFMREA